MWLAFIVNCKFFLWFIIFVIILGICSLSIYISYCSRYCFLNTTSLLGRSWRNHDISLDEICLKFQWKHKIKRQTRFLNRKELETSITLWKMQGVAMSLITSCIHLFRNLFCIHFWREKTCGVILRNLTILRSLIRRNTKTLIYVFFKEVIQTKDVNMEILSPYISVIIRAIEKHILHKQNYVIFVCKMYFTESLVRVKKSHFQYSLLWIIFLQLKIYYTTLNHFKEEILVHSDYSNYFERPSKETVHDIRAQHFVLNAVQELISCR